MAALIGWLRYGHHAGVIHRLAHKSISSSLKTWEGDISAYLDKDGNGSVSVNGKTVWKGNVNRKYRLCECSGSMAKDDQIARTITAEGKREEVEAVIRTIQRFIEGATLSFPDAKVQKSQEGNLTIKV